MAKRQFQNIAYFMQAEAPQKSRLPHVLITAGRCLPPWAPRDLERPPGTRKAHHGITRMAPHYQAPILPGGIVHMDPRVFAHVYRLMFIIHFMLTYGVLNK